MSGKGQKSAWTNVIDTPAVRAICVPMCNADRLISRPIMRKLR